MYTRTLASLIFLLFLSCSNSAQVKESENVEAYAKSLSGNKKQLLDVRTIEEFNTGHLKDALQADWLNKTEFKQRVQHLDKDQPLYIYCLSGGRSSQAAAYLRENGFKKVVNLEGGITAWRNAGMPVEAVQPGPQITTAEYDQLTSSFPLVLVDVGATWCPPCKKMEPVINDFEKKESSKIKVVRIDGGSQTDLVGVLKVEAMPTFILYKEGKEVWRKQGIVPSSDLEELVAKY